MTNNSQYFTSYIQSFDRALKETETSGLNGEQLDREVAFSRLCERTEKMKKIGSRLFFCGNGASAAFASHMALDWSKNGGVASISLNDPVQLTALGNDLGYEEVFAAPLRWHGESEDLLAVVSSSGNSPNVIRAIEAAREKGMKVATFTGLKHDNASRSRGDINFYVPAKTYGMVECAHQVLLHAWLDMALGVEEWARTEFQNMRADEFQL